MGDPDDGALGGDCLDCGQPFLDHTLRDFRAHTDLDLPYEETPDGPFPLTNPLGDGNPAAGRLTCLAAVFTGELPAGGHVSLPVVIFRFDALGTGPPIPDITLVLDDNIARDLRRLVGDTADSAIRAARKTRR
jgi:hypothetical protein